MSSAIFNRLDQLFTNMRKAGHETVAVTISDLQEGLPEQLDFNSLVDALDEALEDLDMVARHGIHTVNEVDIDVLVFHHVSNVVPRATWDSGGFKFGVAELVAEATTTVVEDDSDDDAYRDDVWDD